MQSELLKKNRRPPEPMDHYFSISGLFLPLYHFNMNQRKVHSFKSFWNSFSFFLHQKKNQETKTKKKR